ncbi:ABC transporter permease subunit [Kocuria turfanensis]|uniref:Maltose/maltodextrin transport system permease protein n=1 Tax=Kocuria turfanensis TaxID=388357 RepID=A0A512IEN9_9MICC|nr:ABC transporter permease subunit [Kocuria turfanensis]GEO96160.1 sugar ABC transporter permease [Kocuria turfanensis]
MSTSTTTRDGTAAAGTTGGDTGPGAPRERRHAHSRGFGPGFVVKLVLMALINAIGLFGILAAWAAGSWGILVFLVAALLAADLVYFLPARKLLPAKYLFPGLVFLLVFQVFVLVYTAATAFTNYGDGHNATKDAAITQLTTTYEQRVEGSEAYAVTVLEGPDGLALAAVQDDRVLVGAADRPLAPLEGAAVTDGRVVEAPGYEVLSYGEVVGAQDELGELRVPVSGQAEDGALRTDDGRTAYAYEPTLTYDEAADAMVAADGTVYADNGEGAFAGPDGEALRPGWRVFVGLDNFGAIFDPAVLGGPFVAVTLWTFAFAVLSVALTFFLGLLLAILFNDEKLRFRNVYRAIVFLPYAFPAFLSILIWAGLLNTDFGFVNEVLLGGTGVPWLENPWLAKLSLLLVNLWLGFPYMFLVTTGALQAIPGELYESAEMDGAGPVRQFGSITLPMLMVAVGPLLIASFAMNFNNFNVIYLLTGGGPQDLESTTGVGATDILISFVYKIAFAGGTNDYGLASALSILIFIMVAVVSALTFRRSKALEEIS